MYSLRANKKLKGYTLIFAIIFVIIITCFSLLFLSYHKLNNFLLIDVQKSTFGKTYCYQGLSFLQNDSLPYNTTYNFELDHGLSNIVEKKRWGVYDMYFSFVKNSSDTFYSKIALVGYCNDTQDHTALCLNNNFAPLTISDSVMLKGVCYIPEGKISYKVPVFPRLDSARFLQSPNVIPDLLLADTALAWINSQNMAGKKNMALSDTIKNAFTAPTLSLNADTAILTGTAEGNIIITANYILVKRQATVKDVILISRAISFEDSFRGSVQAFASNYISTGKNGIFLYPSVLMTIPGSITGNIHTLSGINMGSDTKYTGEIIALNKKGMPAGATITIGTNCALAGGIYTTGNLLWGGRYCLGSVYCDKISGQTGSTIKTNFIRNTSFDADSLSAIYTHSMLFPVQQQKRVVRWMQK